MKEYSNTTYQVVDAEDSDWVVVDGLTSLEYADDAKRILELSDKSRAYRIIERRVVVTTRVVPEKFVVVTDRGRSVFANYITAFDAEAEMRKRVGSPYLRNVSIEVYDNYADYMAKWLRQRE